MLNLAAKGICVSDYVLYKAHLLQDTAVMRNQALTCAEEKLAERESAAFTARVEKYENLEENLHEQEFSEYLTSLKEDKKGLIMGILMLGLSKKMISPAFAARWRVEDNTAKKWAGFFYRQNDKTICYANAYLPNVWQKWCGIADKNCLISGIIFDDMDSDKPLYQQKEDFLHYLESLAEDFFDFWQKL